MRLLWENVRLNRNNAGEISEGPTIAATANVKLKD
jgi:hypothetical protein